jgi:lysophospholipase L1-like esterase
VHHTSSFTHIVWAWLTSVRSERGPRLTMKQRSAYALATRVRRRSRHLALLGVGINISVPIVSCSPNAPSPVPTLTITCPANVLVASVNATSAVVSYPSVNVGGGAAPITSSCVPASGTTFGVGVTSVSCTATDATSRTDRCQFDVTVVPPSPELAVMTILAFGDSITEGEVPVAGEFNARPLFVEPDASYPADLTTLLAQRYTAQTASRLDAFTLGAANTTNCATDPPTRNTSGILIINAGCLGERAEDATTLTRLNDKIAMYHPQLLLLLEGTNDLDPTSPSASIAAGVTGVGALIAAAHARNVQVLVGTLLPQISMDLTHGGTPDLVVPFNASLVPMATNAGAQVVDLYSAIATNTTAWISPYDGLHPTESGYQRMAQVWFDAIRTAFESSTMGRTWLNRDIRRRGPVVYRSKP